MGDSSITDRLEQVAGYNARLHTSWPYHSSSRKLLSGAGKPHDKMHLFISGPGILLPDGGQGQ